MDISTEQAQGEVPVTVLALKGEMDASNYQTVVAEAQKIYNNGTRHLLLDMSELSFMSSSGLAGLHMIAVLMRGEEPPDPEDGCFSRH
jgi:anti-anti-sigma factor